MSSALKSTVVFCTAIFAGTVLSAERRPTRVAAAADLKFAMSDLAMQYQKQTGKAVDITYGSSGNFFSQVQNGAPFDLFFSADIEYARKLDSEGLTEPDTLYQYAVGRLAMWTAGDSRIDVTKGWKALLDPSVRKIAVANPAHAPYGRAAVSAMKHAGIYDQVSAKLVYGEDISQTAGFVQSGNAQVGIVALSLALSPPMREGKRWEIPADEHPPIRQAAVVIKDSANKSGAEAFLEFVKSEPGRAILAKYGFAVPPSKAK
jgi:molybdate transport system substrate-binding protein